MGTLNLAIAMEAVPVSLPKGFQQLFEQYSNVVLKAALRVTEEARVGSDMAGQF